MLKPILAEQLCVQSKIGPIPKHRITKYQIRVVVDRLCDGWLPPLMVHLHRLLRTQRCNSIKPNVTVIVWFLCIHREA